MAGRKHGLYLSVAARSTLGMFVWWVATSGTEMTMIFATATLASGGFLLANEQMDTLDQELARLRSERDKHQQELDDIRRQLMLLEDASASTASDAAVTLPFQAPTAGRQ